ncbi:hypothetical protein BH09PSE6_BH09PSE6_32000 [soil metagenome]
MVIMGTRRSLLLALLTLAAPLPAGAAADLARAQLLFRQYMLLEGNFDAALADLYSDRAVIRNRRWAENGAAREVVIPADRYKQLIRSSMPVARAKGDRSTYSDVNFFAEGDNVRIKATRFAVLKRYASPISLLVGPGVGNQWQILEEISESSP